MVWQMCVRFCVGVGEVVDEWGGDPMDCVCGTGLGQRGILRI